MGSDQTTFVQQLANPENLKAMLESGLKGALLSFSDIIRYMEETDAWERLDDNFEITKKNIRSVLHNGRLLKKFLSEFSDDNINAGYSTVLDQITWGHTEIDPQHSYFGGRTEDILGDSMDSDYMFFEQLVVHALGIIPGESIADGALDWERVTYDLQGIWQNNNEINDLRVGTPDWTEKANEVGDESLAATFRILLMSDDETRDEINELSKNVNDLTTLIYQNHVSGVFQRAGDITSFFAEAAIAKITGESSPHIEAILTFINEYSEIIKKIEPNKIAKLIAKQLHNAVKAASKIVDTDSTSEYLFFMKYARRDDYYSLFIADDETLDDVGYAQAKNLIDKMEWYYMPTPSSSTNYRDKKWNWLKDENKKRTKVVFDHGAADAHGSDPTTYLDTNRKSAGYLITTLKTMNGILSDFNTSNLQRKSIVDFLYNLFTSNSALWKIVSSMYNVGDHEAELGDFFGYHHKHYEADEGVWDKATDVTLMKIYIDSDLENIFAPIFVDGDNPESYSNVKTYCRNDNPLYQLLAITLDYDFKGLRNIASLVEFGNRLNIIKTSIDEFQSIVNATELATGLLDYENILSQNGLVYSIAMRRYYDLIQQKGKKYINNKFEPMTSEEELGIDLLFSLPKYMERNTNEYKKIFTVAISKEDIGLQRYVKIVFTKTNRLHKMMEFEKKEVIIDAYTHPVLNGYEMHDTAIGDDNEKSEEYLETGEFTSEYNDFDDFVKNGMKFLNFHQLFGDFNSIVPQSFDDIVDSTASGDKNIVRKILKDAVKDKFLRKYLTSLLGFSFDNQVLEATAHQLASNTYDDGSLDKINNLIFQHTELENHMFAQKAKHVLLENSTYFNNKNIMDDILGDHKVGFVFNVPINIKADFPPILDNESTFDWSALLENINDIDIEVTASVVYEGSW